MHRKVWMEISFTICQQTNRSTDKKRSRANQGDKAITSTGGIIGAKISRLACLQKEARTLQLISSKQRIRHRKDMIRVLLVQFLQLRSEFSFCRTGYWWVSTCQSQQKPMLVKEQLLNISFLKSYPKTRGLNLPIHKLYSATYVIFF